MSEAGLPPTDGVSAGQLLRQAREAAGLHVASLAVSLKVPVRKLEALEADLYDELGDVVFVRALAASVCRTLKIDPQPVLERLPQNARPRLKPDTDGINEPFRPTGERASGGWLDQVSRPVALTVVALLLAAVVLIFLPVAQRSAPAGASGVTETLEAEPRAAGTEVSATAAAETASQPLAAPPFAPLEPPAAAAMAQPAASVAAATPASAAAPAGMAAPAAAASAAIPAPATPGAAASASVAPATASGVVVFRASADSWIQVVDANGTTVLQRLLGPGESVGASGALPLAVTVGSAQATEVQVRGKPFNLAPVTRDNVARFQVR